MQFIESICFNYSDTICKQSSIIPYKICKILVNRWKCYSENLSINQYLSISFNYCFYSISILRKFHLSLATDKQQISRQDAFRSRQNIVTNHHHRRYREPLCLFHRFTADGSSIGISVYNSTPTYNILAHRVLRKGERGGMEERDERGGETRLSEQARGGWVRGDRSNRHYGE